MRRRAHPVGAMSVTHALLVHAQLPPCSRTDPTGKRAECPWQPAASGSGSNAGVRTGVHLWVAAPGAEQVNDDPPLACVARRRRHLATAERTRATRVPSTEGP